MTSLHVNPLYNQKIRIKNVTYTAHKLFQMDPKDVVNLEIIALGDSSVKDEDLDIFMFLHYIMTRRYFNPYHGEEYFAKGFKPVSYIATARKLYANVNFLTYHSVSELTKAKIRRLKIDEQWNSKRSEFKRTNVSVPASSKPTEVKAPAVVVQATKPTQNFPIVGNNPTEIRKQTNVPTAPIVEAPKPSEVMVSSVISDKPKETRMGRKKIPPIPESLKKIVREEEVDDLYENYGQVIPTTTIKPLAEIESQVSEKKVEGKTGSKRKQSAAEEKEDYDAILGV